VTKRRITYILILYFAVVWAAALLRIDRFPLSWAPMYSIYEASTDPEIRRRLVDKKYLKEMGWKAIHRDGTTSRVTQRDLNIRTSSMRRLYYKRTFGEAPASHRHLNHDAGTLDRRLFGLAPGEPYYVVNWHQRMLRSINRTLRHEPEDGKFIVRLEASTRTMVFDRETFDLLREEDEVAIATWDEAWTAAF
jgi:hypothetical protein